MDENVPQPPATPPPPVLPPPAFPPPPPIETPGPSDKRRANAVIIGSAAAVIAAIVTTGIVVVGATRGATPNDDKPSTTAAPSSAGEDLAAPFAEPDPEPTYAQVDADSFSIDLRTTERQCFGSAGCNVTVEPELTYLGSSGDLDPDAVYEITYEIHGDESGPVIQTAELTNQTSLSYRPSLISTASASTELSVEITDITSA